MKSPRVSLLMPTRNRAGDLRQGLRNALSQTGIELELILSDNASTDETPILCQQAASSDSRIRYFRQNKMLGLYEHHNFCLEQARAEYLGFFHDHDLHPPDFIQQCVNLLDSQPTVGVVGAPWKMENEQGKFLGQRWVRAPRVERGWTYLERTIRSGRSSVAIPGALMRRAAVAGNRLGGAKGFGDFLLWFRIAEKWDIGHVDSILWTMRQSPKAESATTILQMTSDFSQNIENYLNDLKIRIPTKRRWAEKRQRDARRFIFWALVFEWILQNRFSGQQKPGQTLFQIHQYQLDEQQKLKLHAQLEAKAPPGLLWLVRILPKIFGIGFLRNALSNCLHYPEIFRRILGLR